MCYLASAGLQQGHVEAGLQRSLHPLHQHPALQHLLLERAEVVHMPDGVAPVPVGEGAIRSLPLEISMRLQGV